MGLLSDPEYGSLKWVRILKRVHTPLCFLCYVAAITWFFMLANREFNNETYFSENALLPGLVTNEFNGEHSANQYYNELLQELEAKHEEMDEMPVSWLVGKMSQLHLEVYTHNFTLEYPLGQGQTFKGTNVYGILRAPRTSSLEAIVVTAPYRSMFHHLKGTAAGIALMLSFAQFARPQKYWAKDIIFLITEHEQLGMQAWLEAYHGLQTESPTFYTNLGNFWNPGNSWDLGRFTKSFDWMYDHSKCLDPGTLKGRSGSIQAAINLEFHTPKFKYVEVKIEGLNGQLPNLDLVNLVHKLCVKSGIHHSYKNSYSWIRIRNKVDEWASGIWTMLEMVSTQIAGVPNGNHGLFHRFGIESVTLEGRDADDPAGAPPRLHTLNSGNFYRLGITLESILRSLNNLLERFHQSYFFYMLAATNRFISIGQYMPCLCLLCSAMLIRALSLWVTLQKDTDEQTDKEKKETADKNIEEDKNDGKEDTSEVKEAVNENKEQDVNENKEEELKDEEISLSVVNMGGNYLLVHLLGYAVMNTPMVISYIGSTHYGLTSEHSIFDGLIGLSILLIVLTPFLLYFRSVPITYEELSVMNILLLIELATACLAIGMHNYPLGLCLGVAYTPLALLVGVVDDDEKKSKRSSISLFLKRVLCLLLQPLFLVTIALTAYAFFLFPEERLWNIIVRGLEASEQAVMFSIVDSMIYGNWLFNVACTVILPTWLLFWQILCYRVVA